MIVVHGRLTKFALADYDGGAADCPDGLSLDLKESQIAMLPPGTREEAQKQATTDQIARIILSKPGDTYKGHNICSSPTEYQFTGTPRPRARIMRSRPS